MRWTALNGLGAFLWIVGVYLALGVAHAGSWAVWLPPNPLPIGGIIGSAGLALLLWVNLRDA